MSDLASKTFGFDAWRVPPCSIGHIVTAYAMMSGIPVADLSGKSQAPGITAFRHELMYLIRRMDPAASFSIIGRFIGGRDMATVHEAIAKVEQRLQKDPDYGYHLTGLAREIASIVRQALADNAADPSGKPWQLRAATQVLRDKTLTDAEARKAALTFLQQLEAAHG